jgi:hypothetical protein
MHHLSEMQLVLLGMLCWGVLMPANAVFCFADRFIESFRNKTDVVAEDWTNRGWMQGLDSNGRMRRIGLVRTGFGSTDHLTWIVLSMSKLMGVRRAFQVTVDVSSWRRDGTSCANGGGQHPFPMPGALDGKLR